LLLSKGIVTIENAGGDIDEVTGKRCTIAAFPFRCEMAGRYGKAGSDC
jgi:kynurenine formamidase